MTKRQGGQDDGHGTASRKPGSREHRCFQRTHETPAVTLPPVRLLFVWRRRREVDCNRRPPTVGCYLLRTSARTLSAPADSGAQSRGLLGLHQRVRNAPTVVPNASSY